MRRWLTLLLLVLLPLQFSWAAAAVYCQHDRVGHARHVGHHEHSHAGAGAHSAKPSTGTAGASADPSADQPTEAGKAAGGKLSIDSDCGACHFSATRAMSLDGVPLPRPGAQLLHDAGPQPFSTRAPDHPERPNWRIA
ncbi:hypothetical protein [Mitsuaria sp. GD03876]|uniref:hypothetical protein n=1 Tax=Mitsuaria sp. GD03876 TaxID=2975399 RepID=UPI0024494B29|nr:hypothetical protein [Mitsuaria sp. GD03876]MDH0863853.1 hypothetical protein [Mitsuaria sp. GD03876]